MVAIDTKASSFYSQTPYSGMSNNPILFNDAFGDSTGTKFYNEDGTASKSIPGVLQQTFQQEYGITLGYANGKLYKAGDFKTDKTVSKDAKSMWESALGKNNPEPSLVFGYNLASGVSPTGDLSGAVVMGDFDPLNKTALIDLGDFNADGSIRTSVDEPSGTLSSRNDNLARVAEHEFLGHGIKGLSDATSPTNPTGDTENCVNGFRSQMGLFQRDSYNFSSTARTGQFPSITITVGRSYTGPNGQRATMYYERTELMKTKYYRTNVQ